MSKETSKGYDIDSLQSVVGAVLPGYQWLVRSDPNGRYFANVWKEGDDRRFPVTADAPSDAVCGSVASALRFEQTGLQASQADVEASLEAGKVLIALFERAIGGRK